MDQAKLDALHRAITGTDQLGDYPDPVAGRVLVALEATWPLLKEHGLEGRVPVYAGREGGPWSVPTGKLSDAVEQVHARFRLTDQSRWRNLTEAARQLEANLTALAAVGIQPAPPRPHPSPGVPTAPTPTQPPDTPAPQPPPAGHGILPQDVELVGSLAFDRGDLGRWANVQTVDHNGAATGYRTRSISVRDAGPGHPTAARFQVVPGDVPNFGGGERAEVRAGETFDVGEGDETWHVWSTMFGDLGGEFPPPGQGWGLIWMQFHSDEGSPPLSLHVDHQGRLSVENDRPGGYARPCGPVSPGRWSDYVLHVRWARDELDGGVALWRDGELLTRFPAATTVGTERNYLKMGIYRSGSDRTHVLWHDGLHVYRAPRR